jgi:hypothetical protein
LLKPAHAQSMFGPEMGSTGRGKLAVLRSKRPKNALICPIYAATIEPSKTRNPHRNPTLLYI